MTTAPATGDGRPSGAGHRTSEHTADTAIEAWGPDRDTCLVEAVRALVEEVTGPDGARPAGAYEVRLAPAPDDELLVELLEEVVYLLDTRAALPCAVELHAEPDASLRVRMRLVHPAAGSIRGAVPKGVSRHDLRLAPGADGTWHARAVVDV